MMYLLDAPIRDYAWGSRHAIAGLSRRPAPSEAPEAELWMGAHEDAPCGVSVGGELTTLDRLIAADPVGMLGEVTVAQFQRRLPFLLKVLAPDRALSIQAHPTREQALTAPTGTYIDSWPKPEALLTLSEYELFAGTHSDQQIRAIATRLGSADFARLVEASAHPKDLLQRVLTAPENDKLTVTRSVVDACGRQSGDPHFEAIARVAGQFPDDIGAVVLLLMRHRVVQPGQYLFVPAGVLHTSVRGVTLEIQANSDNVVRAALTPKRVDIPELLRIVDVDRTVTVETPDGVDRVHSFPIDVPYFQLHRVLPGADAVGMPGRSKPRIVFCLDGTVELAAGAQRLTLGPAECCFVPASTGELTCVGDGTAYVATTGLAG